VGRWLVALLCLAGALAVFPGLGRVPFDDPGEGMHAEIARELPGSGDLFGLRFNGARYVDKPPLLYWLIALSFRVFGPTEAAARAVSALAGLVAVAGTAWLGARLLGRRAGIAAGLALLTCVWFFVYTRYVRPETLFVAALAWGFALALAGLEAGRPGWVAGGLAAFGAAGLAKDPLGAVAPVAVLGVAMAITGRLRPVSRWVPAGGVLACVALAFGWYPIVEARTPGFTWYTLVDNHVLNVMSARHFPDEDVPLGVFEFLSVAALGAAPWTVAGAVSIADLVRRRAWRIAAELPWIVLATWVMAVFAAGAASRFRLPHYGLPAYPALALLAVRAWEGRTGRALAFLHAAVFAFFAIGCWVELSRGGEDFIDSVIGMTDVYTRKEDAAGEVSPLPPWESFRPLVTLTAAVFSAAALGLVAAGARGARRAGLFIAIGAMIAILPAVATGHAMTSAHRAVRDMALTIKQRVGPGDRLLHEGPIENSGALEFYSGVRPIIVEGTRSVLGFGATFPDARESFWDAARLAREWTGPGRLFLVTTHAQDSSLVAALPADRVRLLAEMHGRRLYVNQPQ
jgi:hypothetical protein